MNANQKAVSKIKSTLCPNGVDPAAGDRSAAPLNRACFDLKTIARHYESANQNGAAPAESEPAPSWEQPFINEFRVSANVASACDAAGVDRTVVIERMHKSESFRAALALAEAEAIDRLEAAAWRRAVEKSDRLMTYLLENKRPEVYGKNARAENGLDAAAAAVSADED